MAQCLVRCLRPGAYNEAPPQQALTVRDTISRRLLIDGNLPIDPFCTWVIDRAERLSISGWIRASGSSQLELLITGERVLVDAMEVACSLGPASARVDSIKTLGEALSEHHSRQDSSFIRHFGELPS